MILVPNHRPQLNGSKLMSAKPVEINYLIEKNTLNMLSDGGCRMSDVKK